MKVCSLLGRCSLEEEDAGRISAMGNPILGECSRLEVVLDQSRDFKVRLRPPVSNP